MATPVIPPELRSSSTTESSTAANHGSGSSSTAASSLTNARRSRAATAALDECCTTDADSVGTTNMVRRIPSIRISVRSSYRAAVMSGGLTSVALAASDR